MAPVRKAQAKSGGKTQAELDRLNVQNNVVQTSTVLAVNESMPQTQASYFVDAGGHYYYHPDNDATDMIPNMPVDCVDQVAPEQDDPSKTVTVVQSETATGQIEYILLVQDEKQQVVTENVQQPQPPSVPMVLPPQIPMIPENNTTTEPVFAYKTDQDTYKTDQDTFKTDQDTYKTDQDSYKTENDTFKLDLDNNLGGPKLFVAPPEYPKPKKKKRKRRVAVYPCGHCDYTSPRRYLLVRHLQSHSDERPHMCNVCGRGFKTMPSLTNHLNMHSGLKPYACKMCESTFCTSGELIRHNRYKHITEKPHKCTECNHSFVELSKLKRHLLLHTGERPHQCTHCAQKFLDPSKLKQHILKKHAVEHPFKCDECPMSFERPNLLRIHKFTHKIKEEKKFECKVCHKKFTRNNDVRVHFDKMHVPKTHICKRCDAPFPDRYSYKVHFKTHLGEKRFKCEFCPYAAPVQRHLQSHMYTHTDEKPFSCDRCDQRFRQKQLLKRHFNLYHDTEYKPKPPKVKCHVCSHCDKQYANKGNLLRHIATHNNEKRKKKKKKMEVLVKLEGDTDKKPVIHSNDSMSGANNPPRQYEILIDPVSSENQQPQFAIVNVGPPSKSEDIKKNIKHEKEYPASFFMSNEEAEDQQLDATDKIMMTL